MVQNLIILLPQYNNIIVLSQYRAVTVHIAREALEYASGYLAYRFGYCLVNYSRRKKVGHLNIKTKIASKYFQ